MRSKLFPDLIVNGELVPHAVVAAEVQNHEAPAGKPGIAWRKAARAVAIRSLLLQEARRLGLQGNPAEVAPGRFETDEEALIRELLEARIAVKPITDEQARAEYDRDPSRFRAPPLWDVSHILISADPSDSEAVSVARSKAQAIGAKLSEAPSEFARYVAEASDCDSRQNGGSIGQIGQGDTVPEFEAALRSMGEGEISAPIQSRFGWHIIRMDAEAQGQVLPFATVRQKIVDAMEKAEWTRQAKSLVQSLVAVAEVSGVDLLDEIADR